MPWRGAKVPGEFATLGYQVADFIQETAVIPDGDFQGDPFILTDEQFRFVLWFYRLELDGAWKYRRGQLVRPQKWGKGPFSAAIAIAEAAGPVLFDGWDSEGEPVGRPWATPWIQVTAVSEDQTDNVWRALQPMIELGPLKADIPDTGLSRINLAGGGIIEPVTSSASSRLGQRITFAVQDETHDWRVENKMRKLADTQRRNLAGMNGRSVETTNAWDPAEKSVAQMTFEARMDDVLIDYREPPNVTFDTKATRRKIFGHVYGDSWWVDLDRIEAEYAELALHDESQAQRFFGNALVAGQGSAVAPKRWGELEKPREVPPGTPIGVGFDGSISDDATVMRGCTQDGYSWTIHAQVRPQGVKDWRVNRQAVHDALAETFERYSVGRVFADPPKWWSELEQWAEIYGEEVVLAFDTNQDRRMAPAVDRWLTAVALGTHTHDGDPVVTSHVLAAQKKKARAKDPEDDMRTLYVLSKPGDGRKIDGAVADVLALQAAETMEIEAEVDVQVMFV
jgi:hypothetical protein